MVASSIKDMKAAKAAGPSVLITKMLKIFNKIVVHASHFYDQSRSIGRFYPQ